MLSTAGSVDVAAAVDQQVFPLADVACKTSRQAGFEHAAGRRRAPPPLRLEPVALLTQLVREQRLALDGVPALSDLPAAVAQVEANLPGDAAAAICISDLQQRSIADRLLILQRSSR